MTQKQIGEFLNILKNHNSERYQVNLLPCMDSFSGTDAEFIEIAVSLAKTGRIELLPGNPASHLPEALDRLTPLWEHYGTQLITVKSWTDEDETK